MFKATTILSIRKSSKVIIIGDGQVTLGNTVIKSQSCKVRKIPNANVITGFAGSVADAFSLFSRLEEKLRKHTNNLEKSVMELARDWHHDKYLRKLDAMLIVANRTKSFLISGTGDVLEPQDGVIAIGSGGNYALSAAKAAIKYNSDIKQVAHEAMTIAANLCVYTNNCFTYEEI